MKKQLTFSLFIICISLAFIAKSDPKKQTCGFTENKGQVSDQNGKSRPDVLFSYNTRNLAYYLRHSGISYQLSKVERWKQKELEPSMKFNTLERGKMEPELTSVFRLDLEWLNINPQLTVQTDEALPGFSNYYLAVCPDGVTNVKTYAGLVYKNIYQNIDLHYYLTDQHLKYDYLVAAHADYKQIKIKVSGASKIVFQEDGSLILQTPLGEVKEAAPIVYQGNKQLPARWVLNNNNELSFSISNYDSSQPLVIDPVVRAWGTFYGGSGTEESKSCATDLSGNVYMAGKSNSSSGIATSGSHQTTLSGTNSDAFLVEFNSGGVRQWATYYGGAGDDFANACETDPSGNVYMTGQAGTNSTSGISTTGAHQLMHGGSSDAFLVKFNSAGTRLWGTYYGSTGIDIGEALVVDPATSDVYMSGYNSGAFPVTILVTPGAHQTTAGSAMLVKFNANGVRQWGTFYGNSTWSHAQGLGIDLSGNVFMCGNTDAMGGIATVGGHQTTMLGMFDAYLVKFNSAGVRQWGTYYGEISMENAGDVAADAAGNVYLVGLTGSPTGISTPGSFQPLHGTAYNGDAMIIKFNSAGVRQWGTYFGGTTDDFASGCVIAPNGDLYVSGLSASPNSPLSTPNALQPINAGYGDAFLARFTTSGARVSCTYYGETGNDVGYSCAADANNRIYLTGIAQPGTGLGFPTAGCYQFSYGGGASDAFLVQFAECTPPANPVNITSAANTTLCGSGSVTLSVTAVGTVNWYNLATGGSSIGTGSVFTTPVLSAGTTTFFAEVNNTCSSGALRTPITVTVYALPAISISGNSVCVGSSATLTANGANQYVWSTTGSTGSELIVNPVSATPYTVTGTSAEGCVNTATVTVNTYSVPIPAINVTHNPLCKGETVTLTATGASQFSWSTGANNVAIAVTPTVTKSYSVTAISPGGCTGLAIITLTVQACTGIEHYAKTIPTVNVYPNPTNGVMIIQVSEPAQIYLMNALGEVIINKSIDTDKTKVDLSAYATGVYFLIVKQNQQVKTMKVVKE